MYRTIRDAELAVIPGTSHGLLAEKPDLRDQIDESFLTNETAAPLAPIRRRRAGNRPRADQSHSGAHSW